VIMTDLSEVISLTEKNIQLNCDLKRDHVFIEELDWYYCLIISLF
jgi:hypothetical protein